MSLDVYLTVSTLSAVDEPRPRIFVREAGATREITREEWDAKFPGTEPVTADIADNPHEVYSANITHNLNRMADAAGIYQACWRPEEISITKAAQLIPLLRDGLEKLQAKPEHFQQFNPENGWGDYAGLVSFVERYLCACEANPDADVRVWR